MILWLILTALTVSLFELIRHPETGYDLVLLALIMSLLGLGWGYYGLEKEGMSAGLVIFVIIKLLVIARSKKILRSHSGQAPQSVHKTTDCHGRKVPDGTWHPSQ